MQTTRNATNSQETIGEGSLSAEERELVRQGTAVVDRRRTREITTAAAAIELFRLFPPDEDGNSAADEYINLCGEIDQEELTAASRRVQSVARNASPHNASSPAPGNEQQHREEQCEDQSEKGADINEEEMGRKCTLDETTLPWYNQPEAPLDPNIALTLKRKRDYLVDVKAVKLKVLGRSDCPEFPEGLWNEIITNSYVDLNKVFSGYYSLDSESKQTETIGNVDIVIRDNSATTKLVRTVASHGDWFISFSTYGEAVLFLYPHRKKELAEYQRFIAGQFAAITVPEHHRVIDLDRAIRKRVTRTNNLALTSFSDFADLCTRHLSGIGSGQSASNGMGSTNSGPSKRIRSREQPICRRFNEGKCVSGTCTYKHICLFCQSDHQAKDCKRLK